MPPAADAGEEGPGLHAALWRGEVLMSQQWFSVIGLSLDLVGVLLVVTEWWHAFGTERRSLTAKLFRLTHEVVPMEDFDQVKARTRPNTS